MGAVRSLIESSLRALGRDELPPNVSLSDGEYVFTETLQHSFFAATGLYTGPSGKAVIKFGRRAAFLGFPLAWIGRKMMGHEVRMYRAVEDLEGVPSFLGTIGREGFAHAYAEGRPHEMGEPMEIEFFERLQALIDEVHRRDMAYVDLSKAQNILIGDDGRPYLIDFQIAWHWPQPSEPRRGIQKWLPAWLGRRILDAAQEGDRVHVLKHCRRSAPTALTPEQYARSIRRTGWIRVHDFFSTPYRAVRRWIRRLWKRSGATSGDAGD